MVTETQTKKKERKKQLQWRGIYLVGTGDNSGKLAIVLLLALDHGLEERRMVRTQVDEDMGYTSLFLSADARVPLGPIGVPGTSQRASKKANDAV